MDGCRRDAEGVRYQLSGRAGIGDAALPGDRGRVRRAWLRRAVPLAGRLGHGVLGIEQFRLGHERGGSQDHSRIVRLAQHQPQYAALAPAAYQAWHEVEKASGQQIVTTTGAQIVENTPVRSVKPTTADAEVPADEHTNLAPE